MLRSASDIIGTPLHALDGPTGNVVDLYFDDLHWAVRFLVVETGGLLSSHLVLVSPIALEPTDDNGELRTWLTKHEIQAAPGADSARPVSAQEEAEYYAHFGWPRQGVGPYAWGAWYNPAAVAAATAAGEIAKATGPEPPDSGRHLRSVNEVRDYNLAARDEELGHVDDFLIDDETWEVRYVVADTSIWWAGRRVLVAPQSVVDIEWNKMLVRVDLDRESVRHAPEWDGKPDLSREFEERLHAYYGLKPYWHSA